MTYMVIGDWTREETRRNGIVWTDERGGYWKHDTVCDVIALIDEGVKEGGYTARPFWIMDHEERFIALTGTASEAKAVRFLSLYDDLSPELRAAMIQHSRNRIAA